MRHSSHSRQCRKIPVVLVADVGIDDAAALLWLLRSPSIELLGIASSFGCHGDVRQTAANAKRLLRAAGAPCVPVHVGSRVAFGNWAPNDDDGKYIHGADGLGDVPPLRGEADLVTCDRDVDESRCRPRSSSRRQLERETGRGHDHRHVAGHEFSISCGLGASNSQN